jgi:hypothetical protein
MDVNVNKTNKGAIKLKNSSTILNRIGYVALGMVSSSFLTAPSARAAEEIFFMYGPLKIPLRVSSIETFAKEGKIEPDLGLFLSRATPEQQAVFRKALTKPVKVDPVLLSRFFYSGIGESALTRLGRAITLDAGIGLNGKNGLRAAIVQAAFEPEGLTLLNFFKKFPKDRLI